MGRIFKWTDCRRWQTIWFAVKLPPLLQWAVRRQRSWPKQRLQQFLLFSI
jgi:hypothetical protein